MQAEKVASETHSRTLLRQALMQVGKVASEAYSRKLFEGKHFWDDILLKGDLKQRSILRPVLRNGIKVTLPAVFQLIYSLDCWKKQKRPCVKVAKTQLCALPFCVWHSVSVTSWTRPACVAEVYILSGANSFLLFIGKEWANLAAPLWTQIWSKNAFCVQNHS